MTLAGYLIAFVTFVSWGVGAVISKLAADRIGTKSVFFDLVGYLPAIFVMGVLFTKNTSIFSADKKGIIYAIIAGCIYSIGSVGFYYLLSKHESSIVVPLTSLYPALTVMISVLFLHEALSLSQAAGIILSLAAIFLLAR